MSSFLLKGTYYLEFSDSWPNLNIGGNGPPPAKYVCLDKPKWGTRQIFIQHCNRAWCVGERGGVKIIKNRFLDGTGYGYITTNKEAMEEFMMIKLRCKQC